MYSSKRRSTGARYIDDTISSKKMVLFVKNYIPECMVVTKLLQKPLIQELSAAGESVLLVDIAGRSDIKQIEDYLWKLSGMSKREVPLLFINQMFVGGYDKIMKVAIQVGDVQLLPFLESLTRQEQPVEWVDIRHVVITDTREKLSSVKVVPLDKVNESSRFQHEVDWEIGWEPILEEGPKHDIPFRPDPSIPNLRTRRQTAPHSHRGAPKKSPSKAKRVNAVVEMRSKMDKASGKQRKSLSPIHSPTGSHGSGGRRKSCSPGSSRRQSIFSMAQRKLQAELDELYTVRETTGNMDITAKIKTVKEIEGSEEVLLDLGAGRRNRQKREDSDSTVPYLPGNGLRGLRNKFMKSQDVPYRELPPVQRVQGDVREIFPDKSTGITRVVRLTTDSTLSKWTKDKRRQINNKVNFLPQDQQHERL